MPDQPPGDEHPETLPERQFGWSNVFVPPEEDPRDYGPVSGERDTLLSYLRAYRHTLELKCQGLEAAAMAARSVPPSDLSLLGLVRHMAEVESHWFRRVMAGEYVPWIYRTAEDRDAAFTGVAADARVVEDAWATWRAEVEFAEDFVERNHDLGLIGVFEHRGKREELALREVLLHMIEEYARHCGHADLLRERIDGRIGQ